MHYGSIVGKKHGLEEGLEMLSKRLRCTSSPQTIQEYESECNPAGVTFTVTEDMLIGRVHGAVVNIDFANDAAAVCNCCGSLMGNTECIHLACLLAHLKHSPEFAFSFASDPMEMAASCENVYLRAAEFANPFC